MTKQLPLVDADKYPCGGEMQECKNGIQFHVCADCAKEAQRDADQAVVDELDKKLAEKDKEIERLKESLRISEEVNDEHIERIRIYKAQLANIPTSEEAKAVSIGRIRTKQTFEDWGELYDSCIIKLKAIAGEETK